jgi:hypothetical protein
MSENIPRTRYPSERLSDLSNSQANKMLKECYGLLERCESDEDFHLLGQVMKINDELFHDIIELMKLKGWLTIE